MRLSYLLAVSLLSALSIPAIADTVAFQSSVSATFTLPSIVNVDYGLSPSPNVLTSTEIQGDGGLVYSSSPSASWSDGVLSYQLSSASGSATFPSGGYVLFEQGGSESLNIVNTNDFSVEIPISASLTYMGNAIANGNAWSGAVSSAYLSVYPSGGPSPILILALGTTCGTGLGESSPSNCIPSFGESTTSGTIRGTVNILVPADGTQVLFLEAFSHDEASTVPEPGTLTFFGTGLLGLAGVTRSKLRRD